MDKKTVIKWLVAILANLGALVAVYLTANPQAFSNANAARKDSLDKVAAARFVPSYSRSANPGLLSKVVNEVNDNLIAEQKKRDARERVMSRQDTIVQRSKTPVHLSQQLFFNEQKKQMLEDQPAQNTAADPTGEAVWDKLDGIKTTGGLEGFYRLKTGIQVFGWHPYWMGSAYKTYNFSLLSTVAYYGAEINAQTGDITNTHEWATTGLIDAVGDNNCRVELTVTNMGADDNTDFLIDTISRENLIYGIIEQLRTRGDGVCLDFEGVPTSMRDNLTQFVTDLHDSLKTAAKIKQETNPSFFPDYSITMVLPCFDWTGAYDVKKLATLVDRFVVTGYDYYGAFSDSTGPAAPLSSGLEWGAPNIERSVSDYLKKGIPPAQLLLGLPYYGLKWQTANTKVPSPNVEFLGFPLYRRIRNELALKEINYDTASVTAFYISNGTLPEQYWFDDTETLSEKYRWVLRNRLGGVGIWALGYDNGYPDLWRTLLQNFGRDRLGEDTTYTSKFPLAYRDTTALPPDKEWGIVAANGHYLIFDNPYVLLFGTLGVFAVILLLQVMLDDQPFNEIFSKRLLLFVLSSLAGTIAIIFLGLALWSKVPHREIYLLLAGIIGGYLLFRLTQRIVGKKERLP
jgi:spore germination protein YaaH